MTLYNCPPEDGSKALVGGVSSFETCGKISVFLRFNRHRSPMDSWGILISFANFRRVSSL